MAAPTRRSLDVPQSLTLVGGRVTTRVLELLDGELDRWTDVDGALLAPLAALREFVATGGKRLRPAFCHWAFVGAGGSPDEPTAIDAGAALELLHTFALVHDDVMDGSDRRRGRPSIHQQFVDEHNASGWRGEGRRFGEGSAILIGDFALMYADQLIGRASATARAVFDELRIELCVGQYLDLVGTASGSRDAAQARRIERYKSGKYTVERPLHLGAALAGRLEELAGPLSDVGLPLGEAFQLRDDMLGVFGDVSVTGKPVGDDLREGKLTPLVAEAATRARGGAEAKLLDLLGRRDLGDDDVSRLQSFLVESGACDVIEERIGRLVDDALGALARVPITAEARRALEELGTFVAWRDR
jgi:geranylgeranyl diphosphate synthase, type I